MFEAAGISTFATFNFVIDKQHLHKKKKEHVRSSSIAVGDFLQPLSVCEAAGISDIDSTTVPFLQERSIVQKRPFGVRLGGQKTFFPHVDISLFNCISSTSI
jgi:hypothetical protein